MRHYCSFLLASRTRQLVHRFVISETSESEDEREKYHSGLIFASAEELAATCKNYLDRPHERKATADQGRKLYEFQQKAEPSCSPIEALLLRRKRRANDL